MSPEDPSAPSPTAAASIVPSSFDVMDCQLLIPGGVCATHVTPKSSETHIVPVFVGSAVLPPSTAASLDPLLLMVTDLQWVNAPAAGASLPVCSLQVAPLFVESQTRPPVPDPYPSAAI
jgi:hypothetical protein